MQHAWVQSKFKMFEKAVFYEKARFFFFFVLLYLWIEILSIVCLFKNCSETYFYLWSNSKKNVDKSFLIQIEGFCGKKNLFVKCSC